MTIIQRASSCSSVSSRSRLEQQQRNEIHQRNIKSANALKRYLDLTLRGTKKNLAEHGRGTKDHPLSPYTFDRPEVEKSVQRVLQTPENSANTTRPPSWFNEINARVVKHDGEATIFTDNFLPSNKEEQFQSLNRPQSRPLSGISTKSAPILVNGEMYYRPNKKHTYLQASHRPASALEDRLTRAAKLRNRHTSEAMTGVPSDDTKDQLKRMKDVKMPSRQKLSKDLLPIPCHTNETPHSFLIGARYNCSHFMDSRSYSRLGLYVPRQNPLGTFLKTYKGEDAIPENSSESEAYVGYTSVRTGGSGGKLPSSTQPLGVHNARVFPHYKAHSILPSPHLRKVVKVAWLKQDENTGTPGSRNKEPRTSPIPPHPSPKLARPKSRSSSKNNSAHSRKSGRKTQKSPGSRPSSRVSTSRPSTAVRSAATRSANEEMLKNLHLTKRSSLNPNETSSTDVAQKHRIETALPMPE